MAVEGLGILENLQSQGLFKVKATAQRVRSRASLPGSWPRLLPTLAEAPEPLVAPGYFPFLCGTPCAVERMHTPQPVATPSEPDTET